MFSNLMAEFVKRNMQPYKETARVLNCTERTARNKLKCITPLTVTEAKKIAKSHFSDVSFDYLFATNDDQQTKSD